MVSRNRAWADTLFNQTILSPGSMTNQNLLANAPTIDTITAVRIIGHVQVFPQDASLNVQAQQQVTLGIGVSSVEAFAANALPLPDNDTQYPPRGWLYLGARSLAFQNSSTFGVEDYDYPEFTFDIRSARKVDKGILFLSMRNNSMFGTAMIVRVSGLVRVLCLT